MLGLKCHTGGWWAVYHALSATLNLAVWSEKTSVCNENYAPTFKYRKYVIKLRYIELIFLRVGLLRFVWI